MALEDDDSDYATQVELARLLRNYIRKRQRAASGLPRYKDRARVKNVIRYYSSGNACIFKFSYDNVCRLQGWLHHRMDEPPRHLLERDFDSMRMIAVNFRRKSTPLILLRLAEWAPKKVGAKFRRAKSGWMFTASFQAHKIGMDPTGPSLRELEAIPWPAMKGFLIVLPDTHRAYKARRDDISELLASIDPDEPPRFRHGVRDPDYVAKLAAEAAERTEP